jgi:galactofuranose transport system substrate-binding protein
MEFYRKSRRCFVPALMASCSVAAFGSSAIAQDDVKVLLAPKDSVVFAASVNEPVKGPITGKPISLPYASVLPLPDGPIGDPSRTYTFCFSQALTGSTWAVAQQESLMVEAARHPNVKILAYNTNNDPLKQVADLDTCAAQKVDGIVVWPHSVAPLSPEIKKLHDDGFVVVGMERTVNTQDYSSWVYLDNAKATADLAGAVCDKLGGSGLVVETDGAIGSSPQILRRSGFVDALAAKCPNVKVEFSQPTDYSRGQGYKVALDYLQANQSRKIGAWYTQYTEIGIGVNQALKDYNRTDIPQFSIVDGQAAVTAVKDGIFAAIAPWTPVHGDLGLRVAIYHVLHKDVPKNILLGQPPLITPANAEEALQHTWPG